MCWCVCVCGGGGCLCVFLYMLHIDYQNISDDSVLVLGLRSNLGLSEGWRQCLGWGVVGMAMVRSF